MPLPKTGPVHAVERALAILEYLNEPWRRCTISEIGRLLKIPKSTAHMLILTLERQGYVVREEGSRKYVSRVRFYGSTQRCGANAPFAERAAAEMHRLMRRTGLNVHLAVGEHGQVTYIQNVSPPAGSLDIFVGKRANLHCTAVGKVILAYGSQRSLDEFLARARFTRHTQNTITSAAELLAEIRSVRRNGCAISSEEEEIGVCSLAVPVFNPDRRFAASLGVAGTREQIQDCGLPRLTALAKASARQLEAAWHPVPGIAEAVA